MVSIVESKPPVPHRVLTIAHTALSLAREEAMMTGYSGLEEGQR